MNLIFKTRQSGFAIIEALIAFLLLGIGVAALIYLQGNLMSGSSTSKARAEAMELAQFRMEILRNYAEEAEFQDALYSAVQKESGTPIQGVNAEYTVSYKLNGTGIDKTTLIAVAQLSSTEPQQITVTVNWPGSEVNPDSTPKMKEVSLETMLYFTKPEVTSAINAQNNGDASKVLLTSPWITGVEGEDPSTAKIKNSNNSIEDDITDEDTHPPGITVIIYTATDGTLTGRSNVEVVHGTKSILVDGVLTDVPDVKLTSFGGIVHKIKGKIITDRFSVPLDANNDGWLSQDELRSYWIDIGDDVMQEDEVKYWIDGSDGSESDGEIQESEYTYWVDFNGDEKIQPAEFGNKVDLDLNTDGIIDITEIGTYWVDAGDNTMQEIEVKYWLDANGDGEIQQTEYTYWVDANNFGIVDVGEFDPPEETAKASSTIGDLSVLGSPPSFCVFPICDDINDTDEDCKVPVNPILSLAYDSPDDNPANNNADEYGIASYVCYVPGDCTYQDDYASGNLNGCPANFIPPADDDFEDLNGGWYGRIGNFGVKLDPDDMVCTANTSIIKGKSHWTPSREYVTYRVDLSKTIIIGNEGINTPYSNQTFIIVRKNNKPQQYCPVRALSYTGNLVNEQIKRELSGPKKFKTDGSPDATTWDKNIVLPENVCTTGLSCPP